MKYGIKKARLEIEGNPFAKRIFSEYRYRTMFFAVPGLILNLIFAAFNGAVGVLSHSPWFGSLAAYYMLLSVTRFSTVRYDRRLSNTGQAKQLVFGEIAVYRNCGILFIIMTIALGGTVVLLVHSEGGRHYPGFTIYAVAAYTFYKITISVIHMVKAGKMKSPILMTTRSIGYIDACVSVLSLQTAMFASFSDGQKELEILFNGLTGAAVCLMVLSVGIHCICSSRKMEKQLLQVMGGIGND